MSKYYVKYRNQGRKEQTPPYKTRDEAVQGAAFLKFQGATHVRVLEYLWEYPPTPLETSSLNR